jgi:hypothetical protein
MDQPTAKTFGSYSTFVDACADLEERARTIPDGDAREGMVGKTRALRLVFATWPVRPPSTDLRTETWRSLLALEAEIGARTDRSR